MQLDYQYLSDILENDMSNMLRRYKKQIGQNALNEYMEADREYQELTKKLQQSGIPRELREDIGDLEFCICHRYTIQNVLCYLQGVLDSKKTR